MFSAALVGPGWPSIRHVTNGCCRTWPAGKIVKLHPHAYVVQTADGAGVLGHLGIDTVQLAGEGFELIATEGAEVSAGRRSSNGTPPRSRPVGGPPSALS